MLKEVPIQQAVTEMRRASLQCLLVIKPPETLINLPSCQLPFRLARHTGPDRLLACVGKSTTIKLNAQSEPLGVATPSYVESRRHRHARAKSQTTAIEEDFEEDTTYRPGCVLVIGVMLAECAISCAKELRELALE